MDIKKIRFFLPLAESLTFTLAAEHRLAINSALMPAIELAFTDDTEILPVLEPLIAASDAYEWPEDSQSI